MPTPIEDKHESLLKHGLLNLGAPVQDEEAFDDGGARQVFEFGVIYFHPDLGAFECHGLILQTYLAMGEQLSRLGYPITDESDHPFIPGGRINEFQAGELLFTPTDGVTLHVLVPQVVVKFVDSLPIGLGQGETLSLAQLADVLGAVGEAAIAELAAVLPDLELRRVFDDLSPDEMAELVARAQKNDPKYVPPNFENYLEVLCPIGFDTGLVVGIFQALDDMVDAAYTVPATEPAFVVGTTNPRFGEQRHLHFAPVGIGATSAWLKGGDGSGCRLVDIEHAWILNRPQHGFHEDLPPDIPLLAGFNGIADRGHGAGVLGVIAAVDNFAGVVGIAPLTTLHAISPDDISAPAFVPPMEHLAARITLATKHLAFGDVLLLEVQSELLPVELMDEAVFEAICAVTSSGIVVVEAGGNGSFDLDARTFFGDSGAILVGACQSALPHRRFRGEKGSNFGSRIDCCAWGEDVLSTGSAANPVGLRDYFGFSGTSAAAAIVAGVCLLVQQLHRMKTGFALAPLVLRDVLRDASNGTLAGNSSSERIGAMPDLVKIIARLGL